MRIILLLIICSSCLLSRAQNSPEEMYGDLFVQVQMQKIFEDSKTFADCIPLDSPSRIMEQYRQKKDLEGFDLAAFVRRRFHVPGYIGPVFASDTSLSPSAHIKALWPVLTRDPDTTAGSSLIPLPYPYVVPGGRFREIYYWDSYFTMLGLLHSGEYALMEDMVNNFSFLIDTFGFVPNGNRTYYLSRSQPPFYSLMVQLLAECKGRDVLKQYLPFLEKEYRFWMNGTDSLDKKRKEYLRVVRLKRDRVLNRYWDNHSEPRPESYREDVELAAKTNRPPEEVYRNIRAACESGWDFSSRWLKDKKNLSTIHTTEIIPVDLNCLIYYLERTLAEAYEISGNKKKRNYFMNASRKRASGIRRYCWDREKDFFMDFDFREKRRTEVMSLAAAYPLFFEACSPRKAKKVRTQLMENFLQPGGMVSTLIPTGEQWDFPNGWPPLQWIVVKGLLNYEFKGEASQVSCRWLQLNERVYKQTGKMLEKYNVVSPDLKGGGGEYPLQDGFGWTNGVFLKLSELVK